MRRVAEDSKLTYGLLVGYGVCVCVCVCVCSTTNTFVPRAGNFIVS